MDIPADPDRRAREDDYRTLRASIGDTPLVPIPELPGVWQKQEFANPGGSHYDRPYLETLRHLEMTDLIRPGDTLRDTTSGSAGISLAYLARELGYSATILVPDELPEARIAPMRDYGANVVRTGPGYIDTCSEQQRDDIRHLMRDPAWHRLRLPDARTRAIIFEHKTTGERICFINHSENQLTVDTFRRIGHEILAQCPAYPDMVALAIGNGTTIAGIGAAIREQSPRTRLVGYRGLAGEPIENFGTAAADTSGLQLAFQEEALGLLDEVVEVSSEGRDAMHCLVNTSGPLDAHMGRSSLMALVAAQRYTGDHAGATVGVIGYDRMNRY